MVTKARKTSYLMQLVLLSILPLALMGTGYALFAQSLQLNARSAKPLYNVSQNLYVTYTKSEAPSGNNTLYTLNPVTITNKGAVGVTAWQLKFDVPSDVASVTCASTVNCTKAGVTVTVTNGAANGTIAAGASTPAFTITFTSATARYVLQNIYTSGTYSTAFQTIAGLTVQPVAGTSTKSGANYKYPYTFTVTNSTGNNLSAWQAVCNWSAAPSTTTISTNVNYTTTASAITFTSKTALTNGANIQFTGSFVIKSASWSITGCSVQGKL